jgi:hypothetical protein
MKTERTLPEEGVILSSGVSSDLQQAPQKAVQIEVAMHDAQKETIQPFF